MNKFLIITLFFVACAGSTSDLVEMDLIEYGIPIKINAPPKSKIIVDDLGILKDITISDSLNFHIQIFATTANSLDVIKVKEDQKKIVEEAPYFSKIIEENDYGFLFEKKIDENNLRYDFRHIKIQGDKQYIFQTALSGGYGESEVRIMYQSMD